MKPKAPRWLTEAFRDGVDERIWPGVRPVCWLAQFDRQDPRPCSGPLERFHFIPRQRVENTMWALLDKAQLLEWASANGRSWSRRGIDRADRDDLILLAAWDPRNGGIGCVAHHRRFDSHATPTLKVPREALPAHVEEFIADWGLESDAERRFPMLGRLELENPRRVAA